MRTSRTHAEDPDNREGERHTAYVSALSGSFGYTIGVLGITRLVQPGDLLGQLSKQQIAIR